MTLRTWHTVTRWLRVATWVAAGAAGVELLRSGEDDRRPFWAAWIVISGVWVLADFVLFVADRPKRDAETELGE